jgi:hypothetical protein
MLKAPDKAMDEQKTTHALRRLLGGFALVTSAAVVLIYAAAVHATGQLNPWDTETAGTVVLYGVPSALVLFFVALFTLVATSGMPGPSDDLPEQTALGDAHWATLRELQETTSLFNENP